MKEIHNIHFTKGFIAEIDRLYLLGTTFREKRGLSRLSKDDYIKIFYLLRNSSIRNPVELPSDIRNSFGRTRKESGERIWKWKQLVDFLTEEGAIGSTSYSVDLGYCKG
jgi:hypothetical protein